MKLITFFTLINNFISGKLESDILKFKKRKKEKNEGAGIKSPNIFGDDDIFVSADHGHMNGWKNKYRDGTLKSRVKATKLTLAQQWTPDSQFWARPSIRVFASWLSGDLVNKAYTHLEDNHQITVGAQVEAWW